MVVVSVYFTLPNVLNVLKSKKGGKNIYMAKKNKKKCTCLYCSMECKNCGKWDGIEIKISPQLSIKNTTKNYINTVRGSIFVEGKCKHCGIEIDAQQKRAIRTHTRRLFHIKKHNEVPIASFQEMYPSEYKNGFMCIVDSEGNKFNNPYESMAYKAGKKGEKIDMTKRRW